MVRPRLAALAVLSALVLAGCGTGAKPAGAGVLDCGTGKTAANVPVEIEVDRGQVSCPTAMQVLSAGQDRPVRLLLVAPGLLRVIVQLLPSQCSASVCCTPELLTECPTAVQAFADVQDTPVRALGAPPGLAGRSIVQPVLAVHCSASVASAPELLT